MTKRSVATFTVFGCIVLVAIVALLIAQINQSNTATKEREANLERIEVIGALTCERGERLATNKSPVVRDDLNKKGFIAISTTCQRFVELLQEDLVYEDGQVRLGGAEP